ncbi:LysR substrate-binding domain-containing protein, partial [Ralstonia thomasii]|uniref:LysR substrate-binding domain-containing protein n=1 Tax=Ralstonia thomasii TaxID=3058596 RepID=UPI00292F57A2
MMLEKIRLNPTITTNSIAILKLFAKSDLGYSLLPPFSIATELAAGELKAIPIDNIVLRSSEAQLVIRVGRQLSAAANRLLQHLSCKHPVNPSCQLGGAGRPAMREQFGDVGRLVGRQSR